MQQNQQQNYPRTHFSWRETASNTTGFIQKSVSVKTCFADQVYKDLTLLKKQGKIQSFTATKE